MPERLGMWNTTLLIARLIVERDENEGMHGPLQREITDVLQVVAWLAGQDARLTIEAAVIHEANLLKETQQ